MGGKTSAWSSWLQLIRPPNLPSVPGDVVVGYLVSTLGAGFTWFPLVGAISVALLLYAGGLVLNDWADAVEDSLDRPDRPIPSGRVKRSHALVAAIVLLAAGVGMALGVSVRCGAVALVLTAAIVLYDLAAKRSAAASPLVMGACRGLSVMLGWGASGVAAPSAFVWVVVFLVTLYIVAVSLVARDETRGGPVGARRWGVLVVVVLALGAVWMRGLGVPGLVLGLLVALYVLLYAVYLGRKLVPGAVAASVGGLIRGLILIQAMFCVELGPFGLLCAAILLALHVASWLLARHFYGS